VTVLPPSAPERERLEAPALEPPRERARLRKHGPLLGRRRIESIALFLVAYAVYAAIGLRLTLVQHLTVFDAVSRLAHAYFVWYNVPPKLAAIGFVWPPMQTLAFLPSAAFKPLATSLAALPLTSALFGAGTLVVLNVFFRSCGMKPLLRYGLIVAFGVNPMIVFYSANGMGEAIFLFFLTLGMASFMRWFLAREPRFLILAGLAFSIAFLARFELLVWALALVPIMTVAMIRQRVSRDHLEGALIAYLAPIVYTVGLWMFVSWSVMGDPIYFVSSLTKGETAAVGLSQQTGASATSATPFVHYSAQEIARRLVELNWGLFAPTIVVALLLLVSFFLRGDLMSLSLALLLAVNPALTALLIERGGNLNPLQLRYNMRGMTIVLIAIAWLFLGTRRAWQRYALGLVSVALLVAALPLTWRTMETYPYQFYEAAFVRSLVSGEDQLGTRSKTSLYHKGGYMVVGEYSLGANDMARYIELHVSRREAILTDDSKTFGVMLSSGRPDLFLDRIDYGDAQWLDIVNNPFRRVRYILVPAGGADLISRRYTGFPEGYPWARPVYVNDYYGLYAVARSPNPAGTRTSKES
jgi:hypothetical protein